MFCMWENFHIFNGKWLFAVNFHCSIFVNLHCWSTRPCIWFAGKVLRLSEKLKVSPRMFYRIQSCRGKPEQHWMYYLCTDFATFSTLHHCTKARCRKITWTHIGIFEEWKGGFAVLPPLNFSDVVQESRQWNK